MKKREVSAETEGGEVLEIVELPAEIAEKVNVEIAIVIRQENLTKEVLTQLREELPSFTIKGVEDKQGYLAVRERRISIKNLKVAARKAFKKGREEAQLVVKKWLDADREVFDDLKDMEDILQAREDEYTTEKERLERERRQKIEQQGVERVSHMLGFGAKLIGGNWVLNEVIFESQLIKEADPETYQLMYDQFEAQYKINESTKLAEAQRQQEAQEELERQQQLVKQQQEDLEKQKRQIRDGVILIRKGQLSEMKFEMSDRDQAFIAYGSVVVSFDLFQSYLDRSGSDWDAFVEELQGRVEEAKETAEEKAQKEAEDAWIRQEKAVEDAKKKATGSARRERLTEIKTMNPLSDIELGSLSDDEWALLHANAKTVYDKAMEDEVKRKREEEDAQKNDRQKWANYISALSNIPFPTVKSGQYRAKAKIAEEKIDQILAL